MEGAEAKGEVEMMETSSIVPQIHHTMVSEPSAHRQALRAAYAAILSWPRPDDHHGGSHD
jgi:hypothetical protein